MRLERDRSRCLLVVLVPWRSPFLWKHPCAERLSCRAGSVPSPLGQKRQKSLRLEARLEAAVPREGKHKQVNSTRAKRPEGEQDLLRAGHAEQGSGTVPPGKFLYEAAAGHTEDPEAQRPRRVEEAGDPAAAAPGAFQPFLSGPARAVPASQAVRQKQAGLGGIQLEHSSPVQLVDLLEKTLRLLRGKVSLCPFGLRRLRCLHGRKFFHLVPFSAAGNLPAL